MTTDTNDIDVLDELERRFARALAVRRPARRPRRALVLIPLGVVAVAAPAMAVNGGFAFGAGLPGAGEPGGPPATITDAPADRVVDVIAIASGGSDGVAALRRRVEPYGYRV